MRLPYSVHVFLVRVQKHERSYLLFQRKARPELGLPDFWQGVSGALEPGEQFAEAALREVEEETSITLRSVVDTGFRYAYPVRPEWRALYGEVPTEVEERLFFAVLPQGVEPALSSEHKTSRWCTYSEAEELLTFGANLECLRVVEQRLANGQP
jgi:8-oxo-dGTP pyrophosphatase MutT (NUDIX family)